MSHSGIFRVMLRLQIKPGMAGDFEETWHRIGPTVTDSPANIRQWLSRSDDEEDVYYVVSDWVDEPRFREFERSDEHLMHRTQLHPFRSTGTLTTMHVVYEMEGAGSHAGTA